ncbi:MAG TPA: SdrD B-like domain-containing protein [Gemmataceae bacterium]|nr:SdrD B-like domain-containing protein [Gemmataceae bacterium]
MRKHRQRGWLDTLFARRRPATIRRRPPRVSLALERFEDRDMPSSSIPLSGTAWTPLGPSPISNGQGPGGLPSTGRLNGVALDVTNAVATGDSNVIYVVADTGGLWRTKDGGATWEPRTDQIETVFDTIAAVNRTRPTDADHTAHDTIYAITGTDPATGFQSLLKSTDGAQTFGPRLPTPFSAIERLIVRPNLADPSGATDTLFAADISGLYRSTDGGSNWTYINGTTLTPGVAVTDVAVDPNNPNTVYAALGAVSGDPTNGVYRSTNALSASPTWNLLLGGSAFLPGSTPGEIKIAVSPVLPSVIFASIALRADPRTGNVPLLGIFRTVNSGIDWAPVLLANPTDQVNDPNNYMNIFGEDNNMIVVSPFSPANPLQQIVYVGGYGQTNNTTVLFSSDSFNTFTGVGVGTNGQGTYPNIHDGGIDTQGRLVVATGGGIFRLSSSANPVTWQSLNGNVGPNGLGTVQVDGVGLNPLDPNQAIANITNVQIELHNAVRFGDSQGAGNNAYGWQTVDATGIDGEVGTGQVFYDPFNPNTVYRVSNGSTGNTNFIRKSTDGGLTWTPMTGGFEGYPFGGGFYVPPFAIDPSRSNRLFSGYHRVQASDDGGQTWRQALQTSTTGSTINIPDLPTTLVQSGGVSQIALTTINTQRQSGVQFGPAGFFNAAVIYVGTDADSTRNAMNVPTNGVVPEARLWVNAIPDTFRFPPQGVTFDNRSWADITPRDATGKLLLDVAFTAFGTATIEQVIVDPTNDPFLGVTLYVFTSTGQVFQGRNFVLGYTADPQSTANNIILVPDPAQTSVDWVDITGNLPRPPSFTTLDPVTGLPVQGFLPAFDVFRPTPLALDTHVSGTTSDDVLYVGTPRGVWKLTGLTNDFANSAPVWEEVGKDPTTGVRSLPAVPVPAVSLNTTTGILAAGTYGRGVWEIQVRGLIRGQVFQDTNGNGIHDPQEPGAANVAVSLLDLDNLDPNGNPSLLAVTVTDANGFYEFRFLRNGNYRVVVSSTGTFQTTPQLNFTNFTEQTTIDGQLGRPRADFGFFAGGAVTGFVFQDNNGNGVMDAGEPGIVGMTVFVDRNNNGTLDTGEPSVLTAANGGYIFASLGPDVILGNANDPASGPFNIRVVPRQGLSPTVPAAGVPRTVSLTSGQTAPGINFGFKPGGGGGGPPPPTGAQHVIVSSLDTDGAPIVTLRNLTTGTTRTITAYTPAFRGGVRVATADFNGDGTPDVVTAAGPGGGPHIRVFDGATGTLLKEFMAYDTAFRGGVYVAAADINGDGTPDIITGAGATGGPHVKVFSGADLSVIYSFFAYDPSFFGGVTVAAGDVNGDGRADIVTGAGPGGGPHVKAFSGTNLSVLSSFFAYTAGFRGGVFVGAGDVNGDGRADILTGPGTGGGPDVRAFDGLTGRQFLGFQAFPNTSIVTAQSSGARVSSTDFDNDGVSDFVVASGRGRTPLVRVFSGSNLSLLTEFNAADPSFQGGVFIGGV